MDGQFMNLGREMLHPWAKQNLDDAPPASAPYEERADWSTMYVPWFLAQTAIEGEPPMDARATHFFEIEFSTCVADPQLYEKQTQAELAADSMLH